MSEARTASRQALLGLLGGSWSDPAPDCWPRIAEMAAAHRLEPLLSWHVEREGWPIPEDLAASWREARRRSALVALSQQAALRLALAAIEDAGIACVALKGVALAWRHYPEAALRPMRDIDLLVPEEQAIAATRVLARAGFAAAVDDEVTLREALADDHQLPAQHHAAMGVTIELHHRLSDPLKRRGYRVPQLDPEAVLARSSVLACGSTMVPCPASQDLIAHLILHALYGHRLDCGPLVLADLHFLASDPAIDWDAFRREAASGGWTRGAELLLGLTERWFGALAVPFGQAPPRRVMAAAEAALLLDPQARGQAEAFSEFTAARSLPALASAVGRRLRPDRQIVAQEGEGRPAWAFWPSWAAHRAVRSLSRLGSAGEALAAAEVMRWVQA